MTNPFSSEYDTNYAIRIERHAITYPIKYHTFPGLSLAEKIS